MADTETSEMVKKWLIVPFLNNGTSDEPSWVQIKKSTAFDLSLNPEVQEYDYISDESPTKEVLRYAPSLSQSLTLYYGEDDYTMIFDKFFNLATGSDAKTEILIAFIQEETEKNSTKYYKAWKSSCTLSVNDLNSVDSTITFDVNFGGTIAKGYITKDTTGAPTWVAELPSSSS